MRKTSIPNKLNNKLQAYARVCKEKELKLFCSERINFERLWKYNDATDLAIIAGTIEMLVKSTRFYPYFGRKLK